MFAVVSLCWLHTSDVARKIRMSTYQSPCPSLGCDVSYLADTHISDSIVHVSPSFHACPPGIRNLADEAWNDASSTCASNYMRGLVKELQALVR